jgi:hypothetical protein
VDNIITTVKLKGFAEDTESLMAEA